jgi:ABC-type amino acid transport substrate-binding protein
MRPLYFGYLHFLKLKNTLLIFSFFLLSFACFSQQTGDTLYINYFVDAPFAGVENNKPNGIEVEIISEYLSWLKTTKKIEMIPKHTSFTDFDLFYTTTKKAGKNTIGLGGVVISAEKAKEVDFTHPYMKNVAFLITNGNALDIKTKTAGDIVKTLGSMTALTLTNTNLSGYVNELKKTYIPDLKIVAHTDQKKILDEISKNILNFGYVEAIEFWFYLKNNPQKFLKMQKPLNQTKEELAFMLPKGSQHKVLFAEFFGGAAGFKTTRNYRAILEKYVGSYMTQNMAIN